MTSVCLTLQVHSSLPYPGELYVLKPIPSFPSSTFLPFHPGPGPPYILVYEWMYNPLPHTYTILGSGLRLHGFRSRVPFGGLIIHAAGGL